MTECKSCGASIRWVKMASGKSMPVDDFPEKRVIVDRLVGIDGAPSEVGRVVDTYVSHFSSCPNAASHRKPKP